MTPRAALLSWYRRHRRDLPWRRTRDPYAIWVSEIMLQQTRVETVIPFYERFLERFPTVGALARAPERDVLAAWSGLGYYRRARNLRAAAVAVTRDHGGRVPESVEALRSLPGIGAYTAAAVASIAFGIPAAAVDGNVIRVIARWEGLEGRRDDPSLRRAVTERAEALAPGPFPGDWTQALMELGATLCLPKEPLCERCPVSSACRALEEGRPDRYPEPLRAGRPRRERRVLLLVRHRRRILLVPDPLDDGATLAPPSAVVREGAASARVARALARAHGAMGEPNGPSRTFRHQTYSHDYTIEVWEAAGRGGLELREGSRWSARKELSRLPLRATTLKAIKDL
ncbi:MAG TPA: A/G-specific adenine glycosylase [Candidatus Eisenbacteria bacterium]|nr:A/G-specific adenine glycosylase [Candidatus Eisenbacteria bacterium]